jgi:hypothetical protein
MGRFFVLAARLAALSFKVLWLRLRLEGVSRRLEKTSSRLFAA